MNYVSKRLFILLFRWMSNINRCVQEPMMMHEGRRWSYQTQAQAIKRKIKQNRITLTHLPWAFTLCSFRLSLSYRMDSTSSSFLFRLIIFLTTNAKTHSPRIYMSKSLLLNSSPRRLPSAVSAVVSAAVMYRAILRAFWIIISIHIIFNLDPEDRSSSLFWLIGDIGVYA